MQLGGRADFTSLNLESCIWPDADQKQHCLNVLEELRQTVSDDTACLSGVITADESWIYGYDLETEQQSS
jgi:hypothetical protein